MRTNQNSRTPKLSQTSDNTINNSFRLVAIRPYAGSSDEALKALHPDTTYFLVGDYIDKYENGKWVGIEKSTEVKPLPHDFFSVNVLDENRQPLKMPFVNISAIVGKNGCGKSSLTEFLIRLINNFAIKTGEVSSTFQYDKYANKAYGRVYYETDNHLHYIECFTSGQKYGEINVEYSDYSNNSEMNKKNFFYSIISNYSLYAYNSNDNDKKWMDKLIRKNDGYQMPIVINPMRDRGNIDINAENNLAKLRLISIFSQAENSLGRKINDQKYAEGVFMSTKHSSKLISYIRNKFSVDNLKFFPFNGYIYDPEILNMNNKDVNIDYFNNEIQFWTTFDKNFWSKYSFLIKHVNLIAKDLQSDKSTPINDYLGLLLKILKIRNLDPNNVVTESIETLKENCQFLNSIQFQRLMIIIHISELWEKKKIFDSDASNLAFSKLDEYYESEKPEVQAYLYIIYKTISIFETYEPYNKFFDFEFKEFVLFDGEYEKGTSILNKLDKYFEDLFDKNDRIKVNYKSLKLRQTLNYLMLPNLKKEYHLIENTTTIPNKSYYLEFDELHQLIEKYKDHDDDENMSLLPPPIFSTEIIIKENSETFMLSSMSSGELQMLYSVGALIYHLRNLDYKVSNESFIQYKYVSLILEEVEQYFHPEYQQDYVRTLLTYIGNACFKNIKGINIVLVTHSPFVLSDIPKQNVLFLERGMPTYSMQQNTFGANIHSMLQNGFFLNGLPIGEFAKEKINELTKTLNNGVHVVDDDSILDTIKLVGEPIVKSQLLKMYNDYKLANSYEDRIKKLEAKIAKLEKKYDKD